MVSSYSGTYVAVISMFVIPLLAKWGFSEGCSNELISIGVPALVAVVMLAMRYAKGGVTLVGTRV